jgi:gliding motility-associated-like protein
MLKKILFATLLFANFSAYSQYANSIISSGLPAAGGNILDVVDYNNDGFEDVIYQSGNLSSSLKLYRNLNGVFTDVTAFVGLPNIVGSGNGNEGVVSFDYNNDGLQDLLFTRSGAGGYIRLFRNNCGTSFTEVTTATSLPSSAHIAAQNQTNDPIILIMDYDKDKDNDIIFAGFGVITGEYSVNVFRNNAGIFSAPTPFLSGFGATTIPNIAIIDYDLDLDEDLLVIKNSNINIAAQIDLYENNGSGFFSVVSSFTGLTNSSPLAFANIVDLNHDGYMDILLGTKDVVAPGPGNLGCKVFLNRGLADGSFVDSTANYNTMAASLLDYNFSHIFDADNDGDYDVLWETRSGNPNSNPLLMINNGNNVFSDQRAARMSGAITPSLRSNRYYVFDFNKDGLLDVFVPGTPTSNAQLLRNNSSSGNNFFNLRLLSCNSQADPLGAKIYIRAGNLKLHKVYNGQGNTTTNSGKIERIHFGLGSNTNIDSLVINWPNGLIEIRTGLTANQDITLYDDPNCVIGAPLVFDIGPDTTSFCNVKSGDIFATPGLGTYAWSTGGSSESINVTTKGWYICTVTTPAGCVATDSTYAAFGEGRIEPSDTSICMGASVTLKAYPRYDCSPSGAPAKRTIIGGENVGVDFEYVDSFNGHHYYKLKNSSTWSNAESKAIAAGGYLAVINDNLENDFISNIASLAGQNLWLGLYKERGTGAQFKLVNCDDFGYQNWSANAKTLLGDTTKRHAYLIKKNCPEGGFWNVTNQNQNLTDTCENNFFGLVEFDESTNISYLWTNGDTTATSTLKPGSSGVETVQIRQKGALCIGSVNINLIDPNDLILGAVNDTISECKTSFILVTAKPGMKSYSWNTGSSNSFIFVGTTGANRWYKLTAVTPEGCVGVDSVFISLYNSNILTPDTTVCAGSEITLRGPLPPFKYNTDYFQSFQAIPSVFPDWNRTNAILYNASRVLGPFGNDSVTFNLLSLPQHDSIRVTFDLYIHDTWEGNCSVVGQDRFRFKNGNTNVLSTTFSNTPSCTQNYNGTATGSFPATSGAASTNLPRRCDINGLTTRYTITRSFRHTTADLNLSWVAELTDSVDNTNLCNESWTLDNVNIEVRRPGNLEWSTGDTTRNILVTPVDPSTEYWVKVPFGNSFCYDTVTVTTTSGKLDSDLITSDTLRICSAPATLSFVNMASGFQNYNWSTGAQTRTAEVFNEGWYTGWASTLTPVTGCYNWDSVYVTRGGYTIVPSNDTVICYGAPFTLKLNLKNDCNPFGPPAKVVYTPGDPITGYTYVGEYRGHYYYKADVNSSWSVAAQNALSAGGYLAIINDTTEQNFITDIVKDNAWIGAYAGPNGYPIWMNCDSIIYTNYSPGMPLPNPDNYTFIVGEACANGKTWETNQDDDQSNNDVCKRNIFGLLEIAPTNYLYDWWIDNVSTYYTDSITINPITNTRVSALVQKFDGAPNCGAGNINIDIIDEGFDIIFDSLEKISCEGDTVMIEAKAGYSNYSWDNGETTQIAVYSNRIGYAYCSYDNGTCIFTDSIYLNVPGKLTATPTITNITCFGSDDGIGNATTINGTPPFNITWLHNSSTAITQTGLAAGVYYFTVTDSNNCSVIDSINITNPDTAFQLNLNLVTGVRCNGFDSAIIAPLAFGGERPYVGNWIGFTAPDTLYYVGAATHTYSITDARGCTITKDIIVSEPNQLSIRAAILKQIFCPEDSNGVVFFEGAGGVGPYQFVWNFQPIVGDTAFKVYNGLSYGYIVDQNLCFDSVAINMTASNPGGNCGVVVSEGFTPNGDGINDFLFVRGLSEFPDNQIVVFNRWGETIFEATNYKNDWDGKVKSAGLLNDGNGIVPNDTYFYVLKTKANNKTYSGYIYITK